MHGSRFSRLGFIMAAAGSAVGLGNIWKFPYMTGENGGGAFVLIYLLTIAFVGLSLFLAEVVLGRLGRSDAITSFETLAPRNGHLWKFGGLIVITGVLILAFYTIVIGWIFKYVFIAATSLPATVKDAGAAFGGMVTTDTSGQFLFFTAAFVLTFYIVSKGVKQGIEKINLLLMPLLIGILVVLFFYATALEGFKDALSFLFMPDFSKVNSGSVLAAVGHAFFTLSLGMGTIVTYAASLPKNANLVRSTFIVGFLDTAIALIAGVVLFSILFTHGAEPAQGPGLVFISLPAILHEIGFLGNIIGVAFFIALAFAGLTSAVSIVEPTAMAMMDRFKISRAKALTILGTVTYVMGSLALISNIEDLKAYVTFFGTGFFDILDFLSASILLPFGGMLIAIFIGFVVQRERIHSLLSPFMSDSLFAVWYFSIKYITPFAVLSVMVNKLFF